MVLKSASKQYSRQLVPKGSQVSPKTIAKLKGDTPPKATPEPGTTHKLAFNTTAWAAHLNLSPFQLQQIQSSPTEETARELAKKYGISDSNIKDMFTGKMPAITVPKLPTPPKPVTPAAVTRIGLTAEEVASREQALAAGCKGGYCDPVIDAYFTPKFYNVKVREGSGSAIITVEAFTDQAAEDKAVAAGYKVFSVGRKFEGIRDDKAPAPKDVDVIELTSNQRQAKEYLTEKGTWNDEYVSGDGFDLVRMLDDMKPGALRELGFDVDAVDRAIYQRGFYSLLDVYKDKDGNYNILSIVQDKNIPNAPLKDIFGEETYNWAINASSALEALKPYKTEDGYRLSEAIYDGALTKEQAGSLFPEDAITEAMKYEPAQEQKTGITPKDVGLIAADVLVPFFYVSRNWDNLSIGARVGWMAADIALFILPMAASAVRGARGTLSITRAARVGGAIKGVGVELLAMAKGPITTLMHPIATTKQGLKDLRSFVTNIGDWKKIPDVVLTTTQSTVRLKLTSASSVDDFMRARDKLIKLAAVGDTPIVQLRNKAGKVVAELQLNTAPLMREVKGGVVHTTPWGGQFTGSMVVRAKPGVGLTEQGLFVAHEPLPRFASQSAFNMPIEIKPVGAGREMVKTKIGYNQIVHINLDTKLPSEVYEALTKAKLIGEPEKIAALSSKKVTHLVDALQASGNMKAANVLQQTVDAYKPVFRIISPDKAKEIIASGKTYRGAAEIEAKFAVGTKIRPPAQKLYTYIGPEAIRVEIWLDTPLKLRQITKLKLEGLAEVFRQPFRLPLRISPAKKSGLTRTQIEELAGILRAAGNADVATGLQRAYHLSRSGQRLASAVARAGVRVTGGARAGFRRAQGTPILLTGRVDVTRAAQRAGRRAALATRTAYVATRDERARRPERVERAGRVTRARRPERVERPGRGERPGRIERTRRPERPERITRLERPERLERLTRLERLERIERLFKPTKIPRGRPIVGEGKRKKRVIRKGPALATWKQGLYWVSLFPPFRTTGNKPDVIYSRRRPKFASLIAKGKRSPMRTLKSIGRIPKLIEVPMGVTTAQVKNGRELVFVRRTTGSRSKRGKRRGRVIS